jgi:hypothetical protein
MNGHIDVTKTSEGCALSSTQGPIELFHIGYLWRKIFYLVTARFGKKKMPSIESSKDLDSQRIQNLF